MHAAVTIATFTMHTNPLLNPITAGALRCANRVWMAPLTRSRAAMPGNIPTPLMAEYYRQRAAHAHGPSSGAGLIISEATPVCPEGHGYFGTPGIHTDAQEEGWRAVTRAVHDAGGLIVCQLWHVGRVSHAALQPAGAPPVSSTHVPSQSKTYIDATMQRHPVSSPRRLEPDELPAIIGAFADAARRAVRAGFDGVEIHGANTYLLDQFLRDGMNAMPAPYGGSLENRLRFPLQVASAVCEAVGPGRVGYRISPLSDHHDARDSNPAATFSALARELGRLNIAYLHAVETWDRANADPRLPETIPAIVRAFKEAGGGAYIANGDYTPQQGAHVIQDAWCDAVAFGKLFISNPDLAARISAGGPFAPWDTSTFYGGGAEGYTDYPPMA